VWAYAAQIRLDHLIEHFGDQIEVSYHFLPIFAYAEQKVSRSWNERGGFEAYGDHVRGVCERFDHVELHPGTWGQVAPRSSSSVHHFLKAVQLLEECGEVDPTRHAELGGRTVFEETMWRTRTAFFAEARDISTLACQMNLAAELDLPVDSLRKLMSNGEAMAALFLDIELRDEFYVRGSPTYVLNEGRQVLYGNLGYRVIEANIEEILHRPEHGATWC
jgi:hypothetical protein